MVQKYDFEVDDTRRKNEEAASKKLISLIRQIVRDEIKSLNLESVLIGTVSRDVNGSCTVNLGGNNNIQVDKNFTDATEGSTVIVKSTGGNLGSSYIDKKLN